MDIDINDRKFREKWNKEHNGDFDWKLRQSRETHTSSFQIEISKRCLSTRYAEYVMFDEGVFSLFLRLPKPEDKEYRISEEKSQKAIKIAVRKVFSPVNGVTICIVDNINKISKFAHMQFFAKLRELPDSKMVMDLIDKIKKECVRYDEID